VPIRPPDGRGGRSSCSPRKVGSPAAIRRRSWSIPVWTSGLAANTASAAVAQWLAVPVGRMVLERDRLQGHIDAEARYPVQLATTWFSPAVVDRVPVLRERNTGPGGMYARMSEAGFRLQWEDTVTERAPLDDERARLGLAPDQHVLVVWRRCYDQDERVVEVTRRIIRADRHELVYRCVVHRRRRPSPARPADVQERLGDPRRLRRAGQPRGANRSRLDPRNCRLVDSHPRGKVPSAEAGQIGSRQRGDPRRRSRPPPSDRPDHVGQRAQNGRNGHGRPGAGPPPRLPTRKPRCRSSRPIQTTGPWSGLRERVGVISPLRI
jgi:hypothetical protein